MTPLIDIIFLLLLFFMLTSTFTKFADVPLMTAGSGTASAPQPRKQIFLRLMADGVSVNGNPIDFADITPSISRAMGGTSGPASILFSLGPKVSSQLFVDTLTRARAIPRAEVTVLQ
ncbi:biopolymer transporter ExbD [Halocynthiibacter namhaensis]|uniref:biopolymer transporter ExbD n=1 Tax=Halocynthiibacter namhaensis TaxID=1290553 RepID=UPI000578F535|nr:biopolymer transporter ExbD [Halocynthiibacter namhaensis]